MPVDREVRGRNIRDTKGIPLENLVISEIPIKKAEEHDLTTAREADYQQR